MAIPTKGYFYCKECGALFEAQVIGREKQRCEVCGNPPTGKKFGAVSPLHKDAGNSPEGQPVEPEKKMRRKRKKRHVVAMIFIVWLLLMALTVFGVKYFSKQDNSIEDPVALEERKKLYRELEREQRNVLTIKEAMPVIKKLIIDFMKATTAEAKAQFVYQGRDIVTEMSRYYNQNSVLAVSEGSLKLQSASLLQNTDKETILVRFINPKKESYEIIFIRSKGEWKIDWRALVRFNSRSWPLFLLGNDGGEGEFRLYMRVKNTNMGANPDVINVAFYKPEIVRKGEFRAVSSPNVEVAADSEAGRLILQLVNAKKDNEEAKEKSENSLKAFDPPGYYRVRVKMKLHKEGSEKRLELLDILATHWYSDGVMKASEEQEAED